MLTLPARRRPSRHQAVLAAVVALVFLVSLLTYQRGSLNFGVYRLDLDVYRVGAQAWMHGRALYGQLPPIANGMLEPFTYPPISAVAMAPLALVSSTMAGILMTAVSLGLLLCVLVLFLRATKLADGPGAWKLASALLPLAVLIEPVRTTLAYGQINIVLMALVAFDCLLPSTWFTVRGRTVGWPRGALTGVAGALKLTPVIFLLYFVARRDWRGCASLVGGFLAATAIGFALCPGDSWQYWTKTVFQTSRIGLPVFSGNQSLTGVLFRAHLSGGAENKVWLALCVLVGLAALAAITKAVRRGRLVTALALNAGTELLVSPVSWSHHWVWVAPVLVCALVKGWRMRRDGLGAGYFWRAAAVTAVFLAEPQVWFPHTDDLERGWALWEQIIGSAYVWVALVTLLFYAFRPQPPVLLPATGTTGTPGAGTRLATTLTAAADEPATADSLLAADEKQRAHVGGPYSR
ncbi:MAG TPA: glycosyltransferase 87 family protein [Actinospica sp.]|nr:glycosyltransferase 87 family protein [Actinospica sp.]